MMKIFNLLIGLMACSLSITACTATNNDITAPSTDIPTEIPSETEPVGTESVETDPSVHIDIGMYKNFVNKNENWMFSSYSIKDAFSLLYNGTDGATKHEFEDVLGLNEKTVSEIRNYDSSIQSSDTDSIKIANRAYVSNDEDTRNMLNIDVLGLDKDEIKDLQVDEPKTAAEEINTFVSDTTNEKILNFISEDFISEDTSLILVNALYFNQEWNFDKGTITWNGKRYKGFQHKDYSLSKIKEVDDGNIDVLRLNYINDGNNGNHYAMTIFCKSENAKENRVDQYFESLSNDDFIAVMDFKDNKNLEGYDKAEFYVPNFEFSNKSSLVEKLKKMGMIEAFTSDDGFQKLGPVYISDVIQATYIKTNETGTEAAAATGIGMKTMSAQLEEENIKKVRANDTFIFVISDTDTQDVLFMGRVVQPTEPIK